MPLLTRTLSPAPADRPSQGGLLTAASIILMLAVALAAAAYKFPPPSLAFCVALGTGLVGFTCLAIVRYDLAVGIGMSLMGVVFVEPAPSDAIFAVVIVVALATGQFQLTRVPLIIFSVIGAFLALNVVSAANAIDPARAASYFVITLYLAVLALWLTSYVTSERRARVILVGYLIAAVSSTLLGLGALLGPLPGGDILLFNDDRIRGLFKDANVYGPFLIPVALLLFEEIVRPRLLRVNIGIKSLMLLLLTIGVIFSFSRAAWLNLAIGIVVVLGVLLLRGTSGRRLAPILLMLTVLGFATAGIVVATGQEEFLTERASLQAYDAERFGAQEAGLDLAAHYPLGIGPGQYEDQIRYSAHSTYIRTYAEQGIFGLVAMVTLMLTTLLMAVRNAALGRSAWGLGSAALLGAWAGLIANSFFVDTLHWRHFWLVAALIWVASMRPLQQRRDGAPAGSVPA